MATEVTRTLAETLGDLDALRVWHPYTQHKTAPPPVAIARAVGACLFDHSGKKILDAISSWWVTLHGHAHPMIASAISEQTRILEQVIFAGFTHEPAVRLADELVEVMPRGLTRVFFSDNGSTAVEAALKMALQYWRNHGENRRLIVALENAYHGDTFGAMSASARGLFTEPFEPQLFEVARIPDPSLGDGADTVAALRQLLDTRGTEIAALIVEPVLLGAGGMRVWSSETLRALRKLTEKHNVLLIADEVLTGFGRVGPLFACECAGIVPDIMCLSKGLTGGFLPLGATVVREPIFEAFVSDDRRRMLFHGHSYTANPLACAAARASLKLLDAESAGKRAAIEANHRAHLGELSGHPAVANPRILGTIAAFDLASREGYLDPVGLELAAFALNEGVLLRPLGNVVYILPPYCMSEEDLSNVYSVISLFLTARCC
jgi:adenosylmethionine-8-amino-7-oxononanoate aminotransferase